MTKKPQTSAKYSKKVTTRMENIIVGVDPGATSAVAALNLKGELVLLESRKEFAKEEIIQEIVETGKPVVVTADKEKMPSTVEKIASSLGANKFEPEEDLDQQKKHDLGKGDNSHEIDAYAAARHAYNSLRRRIRKIEKLSERTEKEKEEVARLYFSGKANQIKEK